MENKQLQNILQDQDIPKANIQTLLDAFGAPFKEAGEILADYQTIKVVDIDDATTMAVARTKRLALKKVRTTVENKRKELKEDIVKQGRAIDSVARFVKEVIVPAEEYLQLQEDFAKIETQRQADLRRAERVERLSKYPVDPAFYNLDAMDNEAFDALIAKLQKESDDAKAAAEKEQAEREAAAKAERERQAEIEAENARLKKEAEARAAEYRKQQEAKDAELKAERERTEKLEREKVEREAAEAKARAEAEEAERAALLAPDKIKLITFADAINTIRITKLPAVKTKKAQDVVNAIDKHLKILEYGIREKANSFN